MQVEIGYRPAFSMATVRLGPNEQIRVEAGAMVGHSQSVTMETRAAGGLLSSLKRSLLGGESFFVNDFTASSAGGTIQLAPALPGDMVVRELAAGRPLYVQSGSFVACGSGVEVDTRWGGARTFFASEGLFVLRCAGEGTLILSSYGAIDELTLGPEDTYTVDTGHLVAWDESVTYNVRTVGGLKSTLFSGEGLVVDLHGPGTVLTQTRSSDALLGWLIPEVQRRIRTNH